MKDTYDKTVTGFLLFGSLATFSLLAYAAYDENVGADWYHHQADYKSQLIARATTPKQAESAKRFAVHQRQIYLPDLHRVDRCVTCHVAIGDPAMKDAIQPLTTHPGELLTDHPQERFGCTICHEGQGLATTVEDAHGHVPDWPDPMLDPKEIEHSCPKCHTDVPLPDVPRYNAALALFHEKACISCHKLRGHGGIKGPDLSSAGTVHKADWHFKHFKDPKSVVSTSEMPDFHLADEQAQALVFLMMSLKGEPIPTGYLSNPKPKPIGVRVMDPLALRGYVGSEVCMGCHRSLHPDAVEGWHKSKMSTTYERIQDEKPQEKCLPCHTTGYNPETGHYSEKNVGCEGCHGPGADPVKLVLAGNVQEHKKAIRLDAGSMLVCVRCHNPHVPLAGHAEHYRRQPLQFAKPKATGSGQS